MPTINVLPKNVAELIAAGEVVERPASIIKELIENSIDAGATAITAEIQRGGITYIRVTDNGCGIAYGDVPKAFLRHATSKIKLGADLDSIATLGFRGEALAAVSAVARVEMLTCAKGSETGTSYSIYGGEEQSYSEAGCPEGTTIVIRDIFYNTPARMKFLKKDVSEGNACAAVVDRIALSHPEISFKFIRDGKQTLSTSGDGNIKNTVYSVLGRDFSSGLIEVNGQGLAVTVSGLICKPVYCRPTRNNQFTYLNGRLVRSGTVVAAVEQAYKNSAMVGKFPGFVLYISIPFDTVDVNVHPAKTEVRFSDEKSIFDAVYGAVKNALSSSDTRPQVAIKTPTFNKFEHMTAKEYRQQTIKTDTTEEKTIAERIYSTPPKKDFGLHNTKPNVSVFRNDNVPDFVNKYSVVGSNGEKVMPEKVKEAEPIEIKQPETVKPIIDEIIEDEPEIILIGEAFSTYIIVEKNNSIFMIDKHAAHERIIFNRLMKERKTEVQPLLVSVPVVLTKEEYDAVTENAELLNEAGFEIEDFGNSTVVVRALPTYLTKENIPMLISEIANSIITSHAVSTEREENLFHTVACKAAIKAGSRTERAEMLSLAKEVLSSKDVMYCPHGRPVAFEIKKHELEKQFGRIQ
ncbi:MAG: DNA mismatch repair endonuclease MutL [Acutalibacteraceae bacterium]|nr:DNA mismatch repair endonuclease MutL [Acutalibacteraceae bacterium]